MDGHEVIRRFKQIHGSERVTMNRLTGWGQEDDRRRTQSEGFDYHLTKPLDIRELHALLRRLGLQGTEGSLGGTG